MVNILAIISVYLMSYIGQHFSHHLVYLMSYIGQYFSHHFGIFNELHWSTFYPLIWYIYWVTLVNILAIIWYI